MNRKLKRTAARQRLRGDGSGGHAPSKEERYFRECFAELSRESAKAAALSNKVAGRTVPPRYGWATWIHSRISIQVLSIQALTKFYIMERQHSTVDHASVVSLSRSILEGHILLSYLLEKDITEEQWQLRKWTMDIHDCVTRMRFLKGIERTEPDSSGDKDSREDEERRKTLDWLRERIQSHPQFGSLGEKIGDEILKGQRIYIYGFRRAAENAGWDKTQWDSVYSYLSTQAHHSPVSFYRLSEAGADNLSIVPYQWGLIGTAADLARRSLAAANRSLEEAIQQGHLEHRPELTGPPFGVGVTG